MLTRIAPLAASGPNFAKRAASFITSIDSTLSRFKPDNILVAVPMGFTSVDLIPYVNSGMPLR